MRYLRVEELLWPTVSNELREKVPCILGHVANLGNWTPWILLRRKFRTTNLLLLSAEVLIPWRSNSILYVGWPKETMLRTTEHVDSVDVGDGIRV